MNNIEQIRQAFAPFAAALKANDTDTMGMIRSDDHLLFSLEGSWTTPQRVTLGDLRRLARAIASVHPGPVPIDPQGWYVCTDEAAMECEKRLKAIGSRSVGTFLHNGYRITASSDLAGQSTYIKHLSVSKDGKPVDLGVATMYAKMVYPKCQRWTSEEIGEFSTQVYEVVK